MRTIKLNSQEEWHEWRSKHLGASNAGAIMGVSPYDDIVTLWQKYTGAREPQPDNWGMARGRELEPIARRLYSEKTGIDMLPVCVESDELPFLSASLDGYNERSSRAIEIKCPGKENHDLAKAGMLPKHYFAQVQHQLIVTGLPSIDYVSYDGQDSLVIVPVEKDAEYQERYINQAKFFWSCVKSNQCPVKEYFDIEAMLLDYSDIKENISRLEDKAKIISNKISETVKDSIVVGKYSLSWTERKGAIDYDKVPNLSGVNLEMYRKPSTRYFNIRKCK